MIKKAEKTLGRSRALELLAAVVAALALVAVGLTAVAWTPFFVVAASTTRPRSCLVRFRRKAADP